MIQERASAIRYAETYVSCVGSDRSEEIAHCRWCDVRSVAEPGLSQVEYSSVAREQEAGIRGALYPYFT